MIIQNYNSIQLNHEFKESQLDLLDSLLEEGLITKEGDCFEIPKR